MKTVILTLLALLSLPVAAAQYPTTTPFLGAAATGTITSGQDVVVGYSSVQLSVLFSGETEGATPSSGCQFQILSSVDGTNYSVLQAGAPLMIDAKSTTAQVLSSSQTQSQPSLGRTVEYKYVCANYPSGGTFTVTAVYSNAGIGLDRSSIRIPVIVNGTIVASGSQNFGAGQFGPLQAGAKEIDLYFDVSGTVSGSSPTMKATIAEITPGVGFLSGQAVTTVTATATNSHYLVTLPSSTSDAFKISWTVTGTTPSFGGVFLTVVEKPATSNMRPGGVNTYAATEPGTVSNPGPTVAGRTTICSLWLPAAATVTVEITKIFFFTAASGTAGVATTEEIQLSEITTQGTAGGNPSAPTDLGEPAAQAVFNFGIYSVAPTFSTDFYDFVIPFPTGGAAIGTPYPPGNILWDGRDEPGRPLTGRLGAGEGWALSVNLGGSITIAQQFNCTFVWTER